MKKFLWILSCAVLAVCLLFILPTEAHAAEIVDSGTCGENLTWSLDDDGVLTISGTGIMTDFAMRRPIPDVIPPWYNNRTAIQKVVIESGTTSIGSQAFEDCTNLSAVSIPDTVQTIGRYAFCRCSNLCSVCIPEGVISIDTGAFLGCETFLWIELPRSLQTIGESAFKNSGSNYFTRHIVYGGTKSQWDQIEIGYNNTILTSGIGATRHYNASARLTQKETCSLLCWKCSSCGCLAATKKTTHNHEFKDGVCATCGVDENWQYGLTSDGKIQINGYLGDEPYLKIPSYIEGYPVKKLASSPIYPNKNTLLAIFIPSSVDYIGGGMSHFPNLKHVIYGGSSNDWDDAVTSTVSSATRYHFGSNSSKVSYVETCETILLDCTDCGCFTAYQKPTSGHTYVDGLCTACGTEECWEYEVTTYRTVIITKYTGSKTEITVPAIIDGMPVTAIDSFAFENNVTLEAITIGFGIRRFALYAFYDCSGLKSITIPDSVTSIDMCAFDGCTGLKDVIYTGAKVQWYAIDIDTGNDPLNIAWLHCMKCCVTFKNADGAILSEKLYNCGDTVEVPGNPTRAADNTYTYTFAGWDKTVVACAGDTTYTATYTPIYIDYTITFKNWDGTVLSTNTYHYGDAVTAPTNPTKAADDTYTYIFKDWGETVAACNSNKTYTAVFTPQYIDYTITFKNWDGTVLSTNTYHYGDAVTAPTNPTKAADDTYTYIFKDWDETVAACNSNKTYTAVFTPQYIDYTVTFKNWNGSVISTQTYHYGDVVTVPTNPYKAADNNCTYAFAGWDKEVVNCEGNAVYTATYEPTYIEYTVVFQDWDGEVISTNTYHWDDEVTVPEDPTREADEIYKYTFIGWDQEVTACDGDKTYTAVYASIYRNYTVTFQNYDGTEIASGIYHWGDKVIAPETAEKPSDKQYNYIFAGWDSAFVACNGNKTYTAVFTAELIDYTVEFRDEDGALLSKKTYHYGDTVTAPADPVKEANKTFTYAFAGWDKTIGYCDGDAVFTATYTSTYIDYTVAFLDWDGEVISTNTYHWDDEVTVPEDPTREADEIYKYTFIGWDKEIVLCAGDTTYRAQYEEIEKLNGWIAENGKWYYYIDDAAQTGWLQNGKTWYYMNTQGVMLTGWLLDGKTWYYMNTQGVMQTGWQQIGGTWYYFKSSGAMVTGWLQSGSTWYYLKPSGEMATGWLQVGGTWYYFKPSGEMATGWLQVGGTWYYFKSSGAMTIGWLQIGGTWYYLKSSGAMQTGWLKDGNTWYYFHGSGAMATGSVKIGNKTYNFNASGACLNP